MTDARFVARINRPKIVLLVILCLGVVTLCTWLVFHPLETARISPGVGRILGILCGLFFALVGFEWARLLFLPEPLIQIDASGLRWRSWSDEVIPWSEVRSAKSVTVKSQPFIALWLSERARRQGRPIRRVLESFNRLLGFGDIALTNQGSDKPFEAMRAAIKHHAPQLFEP